MKLFKNIALFAAVALLAGCETEIDTPQLNAPADFVAPVMSDCGNVVVNADNSDDENVIFSWTPADFGQPVQILYSVYLTLGEKEGLLGTTNGTSLAVKKGDLNGVVINSLGVTKNDKAEGVTAYVSAQIASAAYAEVVKSPLSNPFSVQTYAAPLKWLFLCGEFNKWTIDQASQFWETGGGTNTYECMVDLSIPSDCTPTDGENSYFKVTVARSWSDANWGYSALQSNWTNVENNDNNLNLPITETNIYALSVNTVAMSITQTPIGKTLGLAGDFSGWADDADAPLVYDWTDNTWKTAPLELEGGKELKVRADGAWTTNWGGDGSTSTDVPGGFVLAAGGDNLKVPESGTFVVVLHANRTPYVLEFQKQ